MSKAVLVCAVFLSGLTSGVADEIGIPSGIAPKADMSRKAAFDAACLDAIAVGQGFGQCQDVQRPSIPDHLRNLIGSHAAGVWKNSIYLRD
jgi:hypothetical protein